MVVRWRPTHDPIPALTSAPPTPPSHARPLLHALIEPGVKATHGVELDQIKVDKAHAFLKQTAQRLQARGLVRADMVLPTMQCAAIEQV